MKIEKIVFSGTTEELNGVVNKVLGTENDPVGRFIKRIESLKPKQEPPQQVTGEQIKKKTYRPKTKRIKWTKEEDKILKDFIENPANLGEAGRLKKGSLLGLTRKLNRRYDTIIKRASKLRKKKARTTPKPAIYPEKKVSKAIFVACDNCGKLAEKKAYCKECGKWND
jgi:hypothetical protein